MYTDKSFLVNNEGTQLDYNGGEVLSPALGYSYCITLFAVEVTALCFSDGFCMVKENMYMFSFTIRLGT